MKRNSDFDEVNPRAKRPKSLNPEDPPLRLLIPSKCAGSVIGKSGKNITALRNQFGAQVQIPDCQGPERVITISAYDIETKLRIVQRIISCLDECGQVDLRLLIHQSLAGCVIGKSGSKIRHLREMTGARIKVFSLCCPQSTDRVVSIFGNSETVILGLREVLALSQNVQYKGPVEAYNPENYEEETYEDYGGYGFENIENPFTEQVSIPNELAGALIGKNGLKIRRARSVSGAEITIDEPIVGSNERIITIKGNLKQIQHAQYLLQQNERENQKY